MTPASLDVAVLTKRLQTVEETLSDLENLRGVTPARLAVEPLTRAAAERLEQTTVDLAVDINAHVAASLLGRAPETGRESFYAAADAGAIGPDLAEMLAPAAGLRNVLVHRYTEINREIVASAVDELLDRFPDYVEQVREFLSRQ